MRSGFRSTTRRNSLGSHHKVDLEIVWNMIQNDLPLLHQQIVTLLHELSNLPARQ